MMSTQSSVILQVIANEFDASPLGKRQLLKLATMVRFPITCLNLQRNC